MKFGLSDEQYRFILDHVVAPFKKVGATVWCFGSRAKGTHQKFSDLDLVIDSESDLSGILGGVEETLIESNFPFKVDLIQKKNLANSYKKNFEREKILF